MSESSGSILDHLEALRSALLHSLWAVLLFLIPGLYFGPELLKIFVRYTCPPELKLNYFTPLEPLIVEMEIGLFAAIFAALPVILYELIRFVSPGLYAKEKKTAAIFGIFALLLALAGGALAIFGVLPIVMRFSSSFASGELTPTIGLESFIKLAMELSLGFAAIFELPALLLPAIRMGLIRVETLRKTRPVAVTVIFLLAAFLTPPDVISQLMLGIPGWLLFELTIFLGARLETPPEQEKEEAAVPEEEEKEEELETESGDSRENQSDMPKDYQIYRRASRRKRRIRPL